MLQYNIIIGGAVMTDRDSVYIDLFHTYYRSMLNFCISKGVGGSDAEDIISEAFIRALVKPEKFLALTQKQQKSWLYSAVVNIIKENQSKTSLAVFSEIEKADDFPTDDDKLKQFQENENFQAYIQEVYDKLTDEKERELFRLIVEQRLDYDTLSREYDVSPGNMRVIVSRFRKKLRAIVNKLLT